MFRTTKWGQRLAMQLLLPEPGILSWLERVFLGIIGGTIGFVIGLPGETQYLLFLAVADLSMGGLGAKIRGDFQPRKFLNGIFLKSMMFMFLESFRGIEKIIPDAHGNFDVVKWLTVMCCSYELLSIANTYSKAGGHVPQLAYTILEKLKKAFPEAETRAELAKQPPSLTIDSENGTVIK